MRILGYNNIEKAYKTTPIAKIKPEKKVNKDYIDILEISPNARDYQIAKQAIANASDIREDKVNEIKEKMKNGTYYVSNEDFVNKILGI